jgi:Ca2+-binding RTX toxin-like protein
MTSTTVANGQTLTSRLTMSGADQLLVEAGGTFSVSANAQTVRFTSATNGASIDNAGLIENTASGGRAIRFETGVGANLVTDITNSGPIQSADDAIQIQSGAVTSGLVTIDNSGLIKSVSGQGVDFAGGTGTFVAEFDNSGTIRSERDDAIRIGAVGHITNSGTLHGGSGSDQIAKADGIQFEDNTSGTVDNSGVIIGDRHGINVGEDTVISVTNALGASISGMNGSGVGSDGSATVINYGTISGSFTPGVDINGPAGEVPDGVFDGDGDGVDIDFLADIQNYGVIQGLGAGGNGSDGLPNTSEGIAAGGGTITNHTGASITGLGLGILIDDSSQGNAFYLTEIVNDGTISGSTGTGIRIISDLDDTIANSGLISGGNGIAIEFGSGDNTLAMIGALAEIDGTVQGGLGTDTLDYSAFAGKLTVNLATGVATRTDGVTGFENVTGGTDRDTLTGSDDANILDGGKDRDVMTGGKGDDVYYIDDAKDVVVERVGEGTDTVHTTLSFYELSANLDSLVLEGSKNADAYGNNLDNAITGNGGNNEIFGGKGNDMIDAGAGHDWVDGGLGADTYQGGAGNDHYVFDNTGDTVIGEASGGGRDTIWSSVDVALEGFDFVEDIRLDGRANLDATGNALDNEITGNKGDNLIGGGGGRDGLWGKGGADQFLFDAFGSANWDNVYDLDANDTIALDGSVFSSLDVSGGHLAAADFYRGSVGRSGDASIIYDQSEGMLFYRAQDGDVEAVAYLGKRQNFVDASDFLIV